MDDKKSKQEQLFLKAREICKDTHIDTANALDMSQYSILGDETYNLDYISKIDMSTHKAVINNSEFMKRYYENHRQTGRMKAYTDVWYMYLYEASEHYLTSTEPFMSIDEYCEVVSDAVKTWYGIDMIEETRKYRRSLPVQAQFVFRLDDHRALILTKGKLYTYGFSIVVPCMYIGDSLMSAYHAAILVNRIHHMLYSYATLQNIKQLRKKIKIKRIKKRCKR
jgi:hypothetical protein